MEPLSRRSFLRRAGLGAAAASALGAGAAAAYSTLSGPRRPTGTTVGAGGTTTSAPPVFSTIMANGMALPTAAWVAAENAKPGTLDWIIGGHPVEHGIEGFADRVSVQRGEAVRLFVNTTASTFHVEAYRLGWYGGTGARLQWTSPEVPGTAQPAASVTPGVNMVECRWSPSLTVAVPSSWPPGVYLLKLVGSNGQQRWVPLTVRDDTSTAAFAVMNAVTTWQAYNLWGGYSLYYGKSGSGQSFANRARVVSFDRPYPMDWAFGAADLIGNELPLILLMEKTGLDVTYMTDVDLHDDPSAVLRHSALLSLGHDEYWSIPMRQGATAARDAGVNLVFFGANACYRRIRFDTSPLGPNRHEICYKSASEDPLHGDPAEVTANWPDSPAADPESSLIGNMYQSNPVNADLVVTDASSWLYRGTGIADGDTLKGLVGSEYDRYDPSVPSPSNAQVLAHSPLVCRGSPDHSDVTWYTAPGGGGVLATGTNWWISKLVDTSQITPALLPGPYAGVTAPVTALTLNALSVVGNGPAGKTYPSVANWQRFYSAPAGGPAAGAYSDRGA